SASRKLARKARKSRPERRRSRRAPARFSWAQEEDRPHPFRIRSNGRSVPTGQDALRVSRLDLLAVSAVINLQKRLMPVVRGSAYGISDEDHTISEIDGAENGCQHAHIRFRPGDDQTIRFAIQKAREQLRVSE